MDALGASWVLARRHRAEVIATSRIRLEASKALEVLIALVVAVALFVDVGPGVVGLPNLNRPVAQWFADRAEDRAVQVCDLADRRLEIVTQANQVVVLGEREWVGVEGPRGLARCAGQLFGEATLVSDRRRAGPEDGNLRRADSRRFDRTAGRARSSWLCSLVDLRGTSGRRTLRALWVATPRFEESTVRDRDLLQRILCVRV